MLLFALALLLLAGTAVLAACCLRLDSSLSFGLAVYLLGTAEVVVLTLVLSLPRWVSAAGYLAGELLVLASVAAVWHRLGRPRPPLPRVAVGPAIRAHPIVAGLAAVVLVGLCYELFVVLATAPNNGDAMTYHLSRAAAWLQHGGLTFVEGAHTERQNEFPPNAEIQILYTFAFLGRDTAAALPQLVAQVALVLGVAGAARRLGWSRAAAAFAGLLSATLTEVALQSVTAKNDLVVAALVVAAAYFVRRGDPAQLALAGLATALALGTKLTAGLALPTLALLALVSLRPRQLAAAAAATAAAFAIVASYVYVQNVAETGRPLGNHREQNIFRPDVTVPGTASTLARITYQFVDFSGFRVRTAWLEPIADGGEAAFDALHIPPNPPESQGIVFDFVVNVVAHEDHSFFGPLGFLLVLPLSLVYAVAWALRKTCAPRGIHGLALPLYVVILAFIFRFSDEGRYLITPVALTMPLAASLYLWRPVAAAAAVLGALSLFYAHAYNTLKPTGLGATTAAWELTRAEAQGIEVAGVSKLIAGLEARVPGDARLGTAIGLNDFDYPLYGPGLDRRLVPLPREGMLDSAERDGLRWILLGRGVPPPPLTDGWTATRLSEAGTLLERRPSP